LGAGPPKGGGEGSCSLILPHTQRTRLWLASPNGPSEEMENAAASAKFRVQAALVAESWPSVKIPSRPIHIGSVRGSRTKRQPGRVRVCALKCC
jgi:hypothetical protein